MDTAVVLSLLIQSMKASMEMSLMLQKAQAEGRQITKDEWAKLFAQDDEVRRKLVEFYNSMP